MRALRNLIIGILVVCITITAGVSVFASRPMVVGRNGMVSSICPMASEAGLEILRMGGNAFDAFVATSAVMAVTIPGSLSAGGGGWMVMYNAEEDKVTTLDHMGRMPYAATPELFAELDSPWSGYTAALVPGNLGGWYELHRRYGSLPLDQVWARAIDYAENGFPASEAYANSVSTRLMQYPTTAAVHLPNNRRPEVGEICYNKDLANTYRMIIEHGISWLYEGEGAEMIVAHSEKTGGLLSARDLEEFTADWWDPIAVDYKGYEVYAAPPEASNAGFITLQAMKILEGIDLQGYGLNSTDYIHYMSEAFRLADADYYQLCIPEERGGGDIPVEYLLSEEHAAKQRARINPNMASAVPGSDSYKAAEPVKQVASLEYGTEAGGTLGTVIADQYGNLISGVQSAGLGFGTGVVIEGLGFTTTSMIQFADRNADYVWAIKGGYKVPITISPILVMKDGKPWAGMGSGGTETILQGPVQIILNMVDFGMSAQEAVEAPRFANRGTWADPQGQPGKFELHRNNQMFLEVVSPITYETAMNLANRGHYILALDSLAGSVGGYSLVVVDSETGSFFGAGDPRRTNYAVGW